MWIEVFRSGMQTNSKGESKEFSHTNLDEIAEKYNQNMQTSDSHIAPLVKGHPIDDAPALAWVERLARRGSSLFAKIKNISDDFIKEIKNHQFKKVSISLDKDLSLRHIGILGAASPAVKGMMNLEFAENSNEEIYSFDETNLSELIQANEEIEALKQKISELEQQITEFKSQMRESEAIDFYNSIGISINKKNERHLLSLYNVLVEPNTSSNYNETSNINDIKEALKVLASSAKKSKDYSHLKEAMNFNSIEESEIYDNYDKVKLSMHNSILALQQINPTLSYEQALEEIIK